MVPALKGIGGLSYASWVAGRNTIDPYPPSMDRGRSKNKPSVPASVTSCGSGDRLVHHSRIFGRSEPGDVEGSLCNLSTRDMK